MNRIDSARMLFIGCAIVAASACGNGTRTSSDNAATGKPADRSAASSANDRDNSANAPKPIAMTGCLQKGTGGTFILTRVNEPSQKSVGTNGTPAAVENEQAREAENAYRVDATGDLKLDDLVGKQVRVSGTLAERSDISGSDRAASANNRTERGTAGAPSKESDERPEIKQRDLAKIDATSASIVTDSCGGAGKSGTGASRRQPK